MKKKTRALEDKREGAKTNPFGANQYMYDPRQKLCWDLYINPKSETFGNATQSALKAGYEFNSADHITTEAWFIGKLRDINLLEKGKKKLDEIMEYVALDEEGKLDAALLRIQADVSKFLTERLGKNDGFALRTELTGADGKEIKVSNVELTEEQRKKIAEYELSKISIADES